MSNFAADKLGAGTILWTPTERPIVAPDGTLYWDVTDENFYIRQFGAWVKLSIGGGGGTIGGSMAATQVAFGGSTANTIAGNPNFKYTTATDQLLIQDSASVLTPVGTVTIAGAGSGTAYGGEGALLEAISTSDSSFGFVLANSGATGNTGATRQTFLSIGANSASTGDPDAVSLNYFIGGGVQSQIVFDTDNGPFPAGNGTALVFGGDGTISLISANSDSTNTGITILPNAGVQVTTDNGGPFELAPQVGVAAPALQLDGTTSGSAQIGAATVAGTPNRINLPTTTGTVGQVLRTDGGSPQQTSWITASTPIASGTAVLGTSAISTTTSATAVTVAAAGVLSTDAIEWSFNAAPGTGYTSGLHVLSYVTAGNVNFLVVNPTAGSLTPAAATLNWRVVR